jgi:hypothetical protein
VRVELEQDAVGDEDLAGLGGVAEAGRDVDVDAEVVAADLARAAEVDAGAQPGAEAFDLDRGDPFLSDKAGLDRAAGIPKRRHQPVAEALDDLALALGHRRLDRRRHLPQQPQRRLVARLQRPAREADQVGEQDCDVDLTATAVLGLRQPLPPLQRRQPELAEHAVLLASQLDQLLGGQIGGTTARGREVVDQRLVAEQPLPRLPRRPQQLWLAVETARGGEEALRRFLLGTGGHRGSLEGVSS